MQRIIFLIHTIKLVMLWLKGLIGAMVGGAANGVILMIVDPMSYNLYEGWPKLQMVIIVSAVVSAALYLKQSPIPNGKV